MHKTIEKYQKIWYQNIRTLPLLEIAVQKGGA